MSSKFTSGNVIRLSDKRAGCGRSRGPGAAHRDPTRVISVTSGKGGVGKTNIIANLGYQLSRAGQRVLILDADLGLGNLDILLGLAPRFNLSHVIMGKKPLADILVAGPGGIQILPASSGIQELTQLSLGQKIEVLSEIDQLIDSVDILLIDSAAGISPNVLDFSVTASDMLIVVTPEPTSITDAYALMKVLSVKYAEKNCKVVVNMVSSEQEGREVFRQLHLVAEKFLDIAVEYFGSVLLDRQIVKGVKRQRLVSEFDPEAPAVQCFRNLARRCVNLPMGKVPHGDSNLFWEHILQNGLG
ncbi:MAG: MinD/ParA family protein [Desulfobacterales bacterium]